MPRFLTRTLPRLIVLAMLLAGAAVLLDGALRSQRLPPLATPDENASLAQTVAAVDAEFLDHWREAGRSPAPEADVLTHARRLSLALTGAPPSLEEIRRLEALPSDSDPVAAWLDHLLADRRSADYLAERFARAFVGVETGPFLVYRRRRLVTWLGDQLAQNRPYDEIVRSLVAAEGLWTTRPETNFITVSILQEESKAGPDEIKLATRTSRAFLGTSLDCVQCHDDKFGDRWKQRDFHELAAFFAAAESGLTGIQDNPKTVYRTRLLGARDEEEIAPKFPWSPDLAPAKGTARVRLAAWITHRENKAFARAAVNRTWAILFGKPLVEPVDDLPLEGPYPPGLERLAADFAENGYDLRRLVRAIAGTAPYRRASASGDPDKPITPESEAAWAAFPVTPLRPEQVAGGIIQSASIRSLDHGTHILNKIRRYGETRDFVKRYGDPGESEFSGESGTIPQRLLLMNGKLVRERTEPNPLMNASTRLARHSPSDETAIGSAFLAALTRHPTPEERAHFAATIDGLDGKAREEAFADLSWTLVNSTEFSWNR